MKLEDVIRSKGNSVVTIAPSASVAELVSVMADNNIGAVVVSADGRHIAGIISERDIVRGLAGSGAGLLEATVADLMTGDVVVGHLEDRIEDTAHTMTHKRVRHVPIEVDGELAAIVSIGDVVKYRIDQLTDERNHLLGYLHT
ncbi:CBS domain-containing protein [Propioniciclava sp. MC1595]|uniref:CBS domain-containing protein n=1 Tax=unclassified Propioniciclava TaxID=2642922 RepID=UPI001601B87F|nr:MULTISPECIES: CBS domain-containing protein [unclassified Propioniciclava]MBB1494027.1 CBS domain-containing protein [Propioniciclava sp. MC1595]MBB1500862.1 CBS domain-containing protein [Propioniciclava sp. MC1683]QTE25404.1 CBS domain-containing protein [Propioniciclava sp. MC1595]